ncbi:MAG TPA: hypothetical protein PLT04_01615 [Candidatus Saccharibacteria bacterium]|nr:hypothetical protein [Candidatus Saccharibacteria bacterium]
MEKFQRNRIVASAFLAATCLTIAGCAIQSPENPSTTDSDDRFYQDFVAATWPKGTTCLAKSDYSNGGYPVVFRSEVNGPDENGTITVVAWDPKQKGFPDLHLTGLNDTTRTLQAVDEHTKIILEQHNCPS